MKDMTSGQICWTIFSTTSTQSASHNHLAHRISVFLSEDNGDFEAHSFLLFQQFLEGLV